MRSAYDAEEADLHAGIVVRFRIAAKQDGVVDSVGEKEIAFKADGKRPPYELTEGKALISRKIMVQPGDEVRKGQVLAEEFDQDDCGAGDPVGDSAGGC